MTLTFRVPIQIDLRGRLATTTDAATILEQRVIDLLVSYRGERVMRPEHGADMQGFLFSPVRNDLMGIKAQEVKTMLNQVVGLGEIVNVGISVVENTTSTVRVVVQYRLTPGSEVRTMEKTISGLVTEETVL